MAVAAAAAAVRATLGRLRPLRGEAVGPLSGRFRQGGVGVGEGVGSSGGGGKEGVVRRPPSVKLLPLWWGGPGRRGRLLPAGMRAAADPAPPGSFLRLAQRRGAGGRRPAVAAVEAEVVFRHGPAPEREGGRRRSKSVPVSVGVLSGAPLRVRGGAPSRRGLPSPSWVVPDVQRNGTT